MSEDRAQLRRRLLAGTGAAEGRLDVAGCETATIEVGDGPLLVLVHGGIECGAVYWSPVLKLLAQKFRVVAPDVPGVGESAPLRRLDSAAFSRWFDGFLDAVAAEERPVVLAHSLTGSLVARFAAGTERLRELALYSVPGLGPFRMAPRLIFGAMRFGIRPSAANLERFLPWPFLDPESTCSRDPEWFAAFIAYMTDRASTASVKRTMRHLTKAGKKRVPDRELEKIEAPTRLVWGARDRMTPLSLGRGAGERLGWPLQVVPDSGHVPHIEHPEEFVAAALTPR